MAQLWNENQINFISKYLHLLDSEIADKYNGFFEVKRSYNSINKKAKQLRALKQVFDEMDVPDSENEYLEPIEKKDFGEKLNEWIVKTSDNFQPRVAAPQHFSQENAVCIFLSDLHFGKLTRTFNLEIAKEYIESIPTKLKEDLEGIQFDEIRLLLGGDGIEGEDIYPTQNGVIECPVIYQTQALTKSLFRLILNLREVFNVPVIVDCVYGNHGRMSKSADVRSNWDNAVYLMLSEMLELVDDEYVTFNLNFEEFQIVTIKRTRLLLTHHGTKHMGTPAMQVKFLGWVIDEQVDAACHGHFHQWKIETTLGRIMISNGSLSGKDDLARQMGVAEPPRQAWWLAKPSGFSHFSYFEWKK